uniref:ARAD1B14190p n=1 Tax=Blastobotrys adeninivorans TaxID=409370 RepID=A0A060TB96_BLAAD
MVLIAAGQFCATSNLVQNAASVGVLIKRAAAVGARVLFLPEASDYIGSNGQETVSLAREVDQSPFIQGVREHLRALPEANRLEISVGVHEPAAGGRVKNTLLWLDNQGNVLHRYQKLHLFDVEIANGPILKESQSVEPGSEVLAPFDTAIGKVGAAICYDIRFPEHALKLRSLGAQILQYPSAFTVRTGQAHWEALARARAIDTQSYVVMAAQVGKHDEAGKRQSYGHSMIVDPWGSVIAQAPDTDSNPRIIVADIDLDTVARVRRDMPLWQQRRTDIFP